MRVLIDARSVNPELDGIGRHALTLLLGLSYLESDLEFLVWYGNPLPLKVIERSGGPFRNRFQWIKSAANVSDGSPFLGSLELAWVRKTQGVDLYHDVGMLGLRVGRLPVVATVHALGDLHIPNKPPRTGRIKRELGSARLLIAVSETVAQEIETELHISMPKIRVISNAIDPWYTEHIGREEIMGMRERFRLTNPYFLCVTADRPVKNSGLVVSTALEQEPGKRSEHWVFTLPNHEDLKKNDALRFLGNVEDVWLRPLYADCLAAITPSLYEGFSLPPIEALSLGALPVVSDIAAHRETLGAILPVELFFDPKSREALERSLDCVRNGGEHLKSAVLEKFRMVSNRYSCKETAARVHAVYREVLS